jgi:hypothetical protein
MLQLDAHCSLGYPRNPIPVNERIGGPSALSGESVEAYDIKKSRENFAGWMGASRKPAPSKPRLPKSASFYVLQLAEENK